MIRGASRIWWELEPLFHEPGPYTFQLQYGHTPLSDAVDWTNVGTPVTNGYYALDKGWRDGGTELLTHYRVTLTTPENIYVSQPASCFGELTERDWLLSREIIRKEQLRHRLVSVPGYLLKQYRYGKPCPQCRDPLTQEPTDNNCRICNGTGFEVGYHPPLAVQCWDLSPATIDEKVDAQVKGSTRENAYVTARVLGFPALNLRDIWVNGSSDERWQVERIKVAAAVRNVPVVYEVTMGLMPFNNSIYAVEVGGEFHDRDQRPLATFEGCGHYILDHNYGGADNLAYADAAGDPVEGAFVYAIKKSDFDAATPLLPDRDLAVARTTTVANGRWAISLKLAAGEYGILYEKPGEYGPNTQFITILPDGEGYAVLWEPSASLGEEDDNPNTIENEEEVITTETPAVPTGQGSDISTEQSEQFIIPQPQPPRPSDDFWNV